MLIESQYVVSCAWLFSHSAVFLLFIHVVAVINSLYIHTHTHLYWLLYFLAIMNNSVMNFHELPSLDTYFNLFWIGEELFDVW